MNKRHKTILRSFFIGLVSASGLLLMYFLLIGLLQSWEHATELLKMDYFFVGAISGGFGFQLGLYSYIRSVKKIAANGRLSVLATSGTGTSSFSMLACCLHHLGDVLPLIGFSGATLFFEQYRYPLMSIGIGVNILTIILMFRLIDKNRLWPRFVFTILIVFALGIVLAGCSSNPSNSKDAVAQSQVEQGSNSEGTNSDSTGVATNQADRYVRSDNGEGGVQVEAVLISPEYLKATGGNDLLKKYDLSKNIIIEISMTTHMGNLTQYPIFNQAELTVNGEIVKPSSWDIAANDSHHPRGYLVFPANPDIESSKLQLNLKDLNGIPDRLFSW